MPGLSAELSLITLHWFLTAFASVVPVRLLLRLWDLLFYDGSRVLFQTTLGMLRLKVLSPPDLEPREPHAASRHPPPGTQWPLLRSLGGVGAPCAQLSIQGSHTCLGMVMAVSSWA